MRYLTCTEVAEALNVSVPTVKRYIYEGKIASTKLPGGRHRIAESEVARLLDPHTASPEGWAGSDADDPACRITLLERWVTDLESEVERLSASLQVMAQYLARAIGEEVRPLGPEGDAPCEVLVLGPGCRRCDALHATVSRILSALDRPDINLRYIKSLDEIAAFGPILTPALIVNGQVLVSGRIPKDRALAEMVRKHIPPHEEPAS